MLLWHSIDFGLYFYSFFYSIPNTKSKTQWVNTLKDLQRAKESIFQQVYIHLECFYIFTGEEVTNFVFPFLFLLFRVTRLTVLRTRDSISLQNLGSSSFLCVLVALQKKKKKKDSKEEEILSIKRQVRLCSMKWRWSLKCLQLQSNEIKINKQHFLQLEYVLCVYHL